MEKRLSKQEAGYCLPVKSCAGCMYSYFDTMEDARCNKLEYPARVDAGGICKLYLQGMTMQQGIALGRNLDNGRRETMGEGSDSEAVSTTT